MTKQTVLVWYFSVCFLVNQYESITTPASKDPFSDPAHNVARYRIGEEGQEIDPFENQPEVLREKEELKRHQEELDKIGNKDPYLREEIELEFRKRYRPFIDLESILDRNVQEQNVVPAMKLARPPAPRPLNPIDERTGVEKMLEFRSGYFYLQDESAIDAPKKKNWTTCDQFRQNAPLFVPDDIFGINWVPFYQYAGVQEALDQSPLTFFIPTTHGMIAHYLKKYGHLKSNYSINWEKKSLLMRQPIRDTELLLIQADKNGLFYGIYEMEFPQDDEHGLIESAMTSPIVTLQFKIFENFLAMMYCEKQMALLMAREGFEPPTDAEKEEVGRRLKFRGVGRVLVRDATREKEIANVLEQQRKDAELINNFKLPKRTSNDEYPEYGAPNQNHGFSSSGNQMRTGWVNPVEAENNNNPFSKFQKGNEMSRGGWERFE